MPESASPPRNFAQKSRRGGGGGGAGGALVGKPWAAMEEAGFGELGGGIPRVS